MTGFIRRYSDWFALFGLIFLLVGMLGTARQFKELVVMSGGTPPDGFLPISVDLNGPPEQGHAPALAARQGAAAPAPRPGITRTPQQAAAAAPTARSRAYLPSISNSARPVAPAADYPAPADAAQALPTQEPPAPTPAPSPTPLPAPVLPDWIDIPVIGLSAPVIPVAPVAVSVQGGSYEQWEAPNQPAAGWHDRSARLFEGGNVVLNGHHNIYGNVFANLKDLQVGNEIIVTGGGETLTYVVAQVMILEERFATIEQRNDNARWILPSDDSRLTLVTCWPANSNTHRLIVVASLGGNP